MDRINKAKAIKYLPMILILIILGVVLITSSTFNVNKSEEENNKMTFDENEYEATLEKRLKELIEKIDGVGDVNVMVTLEGSAIYSYAYNSNENVSAEGYVKKEMNIVMSAKSSSVKEAVISGYTLPKIKGAAVVCGRKLTASLLEKVIGTVSASLGISTDKIYVTN